MAEVYELNFNVPGGMPTSGSNAPGMAGGSAEDRENATMRNYGKLLKDNTSGFWKKIGVAFTLRSLLKQSQLFTGTFGAFFQIVGAFIDVILTPFMPLIIPVIKKLASWIPQIKEDAQSIFNFGKAVFKIIWYPIKALIDGIKVILPDSIENMFGKLFSHRAWGYLLATIAAAGLTSAGRGLIGKGISEVGMMRPQAMGGLGGSYFGMRTAGAGGALARGTRWGSGHRFGSLRGMGMGARMAGGAGIAAGGLMMAGNMSQEGASGASRGLAAAGMAAQVGGMFFGPIGMAVGTALNMGLQAYSMKMASDNRRRQQEATMMNQHGMMGGGTQTTVNLYTSDGTLISDQKLVGTAIEKGGLLPHVEVQQRQGPNR